MHDAVEYQYEKYTTQVFNTKIRKCIRISASRTKNIINLPEILLRLLNWIPNMKI
jgi:hypothetical protein